MLFCSLPIPSHTQRSPFTNLFPMWDLRKSTPPTGFARSTHCPPDPVRLPSGCKRSNKTGANTIRSLFPYPSLSLRVHPPCLKLFVLVSQWGTQEVPPLNFPGRCPP
eukprot:Hpha_TRINITY_DN14117_c0_g1::TRINITY_DN14117_c0_g1_i1::g.10502::m.10502